MIKFFATFLGILFFIHIFLYFSFKNILGLPLSNRFQGYSLTILALAFPLAAILNRFFHNFLTQAIAGLSGFWFALSIYLVACFVFLWAVKGGIFVYAKISSGYSFSEVRTTGPLILTARIFSIAAFLFTLYGVYHAWKIEITRLSVRLEGLPKVWKGKKIMQISDVHLGSVWGNGRLAKIREIALQEKPEIIVITGDLFDGSCGRPEVFIRALKDLAGVNPLYGIYFVSGNHERYSSYDEKIQVVRDSNITPLENKTVVLDGLQFIGIQYPDLANPENFSADHYDLDDRNHYDPGLPSVLLYHTPNEFNDTKPNVRQMQREAYTNPNTAFVKARKYKIDLQLSGHTHAGQFFPFTWITKILYNNFHYGLHSVESFQIYIHSGTGTWGPPVRHVYPSEVAILELLPKP